MGQDGEDGQGQASTDVTGDARYRELLRGDQANERRILYSEIAILVFITLLVGGYILALWFMTDFFASLHV